MDKNELMKELKISFEKVKAELGFESSFKEIDDIFFIQDHILKEGFVSDHLSRMVCSRIVDVLSAWNSYLYSLVFPNPGSLINVTENKVFSNAEQEEIWQLINEIMVLISTNTLVAASYEKKKEAELIDRSVYLWKKKLSPKLKDIVSKVNDEWVRRVKEKKVN